MKGNVKEIYTIFDGVDKELIIPVYQRNYDWGEKQCERLYDDLVDVVRHDREKHFFGAVVGKPDTGFQWVVIDGQQRLTTTSLLMLALSNALRDGSVTSADPALGQKIRRNYLVGNDDFGAGETKLKLKPVKDDLKAYQQLLLGQEPTEGSTITANYRYFRKRIAQAELTGDELWEAIMRLEAMILDLESHDEPQRIFESLNSTGKELKESDKIRNLVLMGLPAKKQTVLYEQFWNPIEHNVHFDTDAFVRLYLVSRTRRTPRFDQVYEAFRSFLETTDAPVETTLESMLEYSQHFRDLNSAATGVPRADTRLRRFNLLRHEVAMPTLMPLLGEYRSGRIDADDFANAIELFDSYLFRRVVVGVPSNALNKIFATLYSEAKRLRTPDTPITEIFSYLLLRREETSGRFPTDEEFREEFLTRNFFNFTPQNRRYLFECLENNWSKDNQAIATALERGDLSIEHVMPQTLTKEWRSELGEDAERVHQTWLHRIGNLTITGYNSEYSNAAFSTKKTIAGGFGQSPFHLNHYIKDTSTWTEADMRHRTELLTGVALRYWTMATSNFEPKVEPLPSLTMGEDTSFTNRVIVSYELNGTTNTVSSFKDMMRLVLRQLLAEHRPAILEYAANNGVGFTVGPKASSRYQEEIEPGLWVTSSNPTNEKMTILRALFHHLDLNTDDLVLTLRPYSASEPDPDGVNPYSELVKFAPQFEVLAGADITADDIAELRSELEAAFVEFDVEDWQSVTRGRDYSAMAEPSAVAEHSVEECLASIKMVKEIDSLVGGMVIRAVADGAMGRWLNRIAESTETKSSKDVPAMWKKLRSLVASIPQGKWCSYGDLAKAIGSAAQPVGNYLAANPVPGAYRVLKSDGSISAGFSWLDEAEERSPRKLLESEGIRFDDAGRASQDQRWGIPE